MMMVVTNARLRILASYEAKIAKICNFWTFRPVILFFPKRAKQAGLSAHFKVDGAFGRVDGENDYIYYARNLKI